MNLHPELVTALLAERERELSRRTMQPPRRRADKPRRRRLRVWPAGRTETRWA